MDPKILRTLATVNSINWLTGPYFESFNDEVGLTGGKVWWKELRKVHGVLWGLYAATGDWRYLALDTFGGAVAKLAIDK